MCKKSLKWICLFGVLILMLSCNLPFKAQPTQPGTAQNGSTAAPPTAGSQGVSPTAKPAPTQKGGQPNPSDFKGGITAKAGYDQALKEALKWSPAAVLSEIVETTVSQEGKGKTWTYYFADDTLTTPEKG